jgi:hypothetical protein
MQYWFLGSELVPDVAVAISGRNDLMFSDFVSAVEELKVVITRSELPGPTWKKPPSELAREPREYCLLPLRGQRRPEADAAYWLYEQLKRWPGIEGEAARRLNVSGSVLHQMKGLAGRAFDRKASPGSRRLTSEEHALLRSTVLPALLDETAQPHVELVLGIPFDQVLELWAALCLAQVRLADDAFRLLVTLDL